MELLVKNLPTTAPLKKTQNTTLEFVKEAAFLARFLPPSQDIRSGHARFIDERYFYILREALGGASMASNCYRFYPEGRKNAFYCDDEVNQIAQWFDGKEGKEAKKSMVETVSILRRGEDMWESKTISSVEGLPYKLKRVLFAITFGTAKPYQHSVLTLSHVEATLQKMREGNGTPIVVGSGTSWNFTPDGKLHIQRLLSFKTKFSATIGNEDPRETLEDLLSLIRGERRLSIALPAPEKKVPSEDAINRKTLPALLKRVASASGKEINSVVFAANLGILVDTYHHNPTIFPPLQIRDLPLNVLQQTDYEFGPTISPTACSSLKLGHGWIVALAIQHPRLRPAVERTLVAFCRKSESHPRILIQAATEAVPLRSKRLFEAMCRLALLAPRVGFKLETRMGAVEVINAMVSTDDSFRRENLKKAYKVISATLTFCNNAKSSYVIHERADAFSAAIKRLNEILTPMTAALSNSAKKS